MNHLFYIAAALASFAILAPTAAEAARCKQGQIYRVSQGVCVSKASAIRAGVYRPRVKKRAPSIRNSRIDRSIAPAIASLRVTPQIQHEINLRAWLTAERRRMIAETMP
ncbi:MAG: hypothetical protein Q8M31_21945 [Beijerinckiaceae bacterium]|nr:hypothetical protein [Beijerinckiaceae bacterium]